MPFHRVPQGKIYVYAVLVATGILFFPPPLDVSRFLEFVQDTLDGAIGDSDALCYILDSHRWILRQTNQHMRMIGQERPGRFLGPASLSL
jgi:hypothetical protein